MANGSMRSWPAVWLACTLAAMLMGQAGCRSDQLPKTGLERRLIVSSDDAGMCSSVNAATVAALEDGIVSSVSIMSCCPAFSEFAEFAANHPEYDYGVHLTLTCDMPVQAWGPVSPAKHVPSLLNNARHFWPTTSEVAQHAKIEEAERELRAQIERARQAGIRITHLDHHMFVLYGRPDLIDLYVRLAVEYDLPVRICEEPPLGYRRTASPDWIAAYQRAVRNLRAANLPLIDAIESANYGVRPGEKRAYHLDTLRNLRPGASELVVHCAFNSGFSVEPPDVDRRAADTRFVLSHEALEETRRLRIRRIDWKQLR